MNVAQLALTQAPPLSVPLRFFLTAPLFGFLAGLLLVYQGPALLNSRWAFEMLALTHLLTLGVITMVMMGALLQMLPVLAGISVPYPVPFSTLLHGSLTLGSFALIVGFWFEQRLWLQSGVLLLGFCFLSFLLIIGYCLIRMQTHGSIITAMRLASSALAITVLMGLALAGMFGYGWTWVMPQSWTAIHVAWGLLGWISLLIIGIAYQVVPMFQITPAYPTPLTAWLIPGLFSLLLLWTICFSLAPANPLCADIAQGVAVLLGLGLALFALMTLDLQRRRLRRLPDVTLNYWRVGMIGLLASISLGILSLWITWPKYALLLGSLFILGFVLPVMQGMLYKIVPFLVWLHLQNSQATRPNDPITLPNMRQIITYQQAQRQFWLYVLSVVSLGIAFWYPPLIYFAGISIMLSFLGLGVNLIQAYSVYCTLSR